MTPSMDLVLAVDAHWGIGRDNALPWPKLDADLRHFKTLTSAAPAGLRNAVIMGRRTWESREVQRRPLPRRRNVVVTRGELEVPEGVMVATSLDDALAQLAAVPDLAAVFVIGGAEIYRLALEHPASRAVFLTRVRERYPCDTFVPDLDQLCDVDPSWPASEHVDDGVAYRIEKLALRPRR
jgi:dihydrofolate reductase